LDCMQGWDICADKYCYMRKWMDIGRLWDL
jgi:hypothetical protein